MSLKNLNNIFRLDCIRILFIVLTQSQPYEFLIKINSEIRTDLQKHNLLHVFEMYYGIINNTEKQSEVKETRIKLYHATELCKRDTSITIRDYNFISISEFLTEIQNKMIDVELLQRLSHDLNWDYQDVLVTQITTILEVQELEFDVVQDIFGKEQIIVNSSIENIMNLCQPYIDEISNTGLLAKSLIAYVDKVNIIITRLT